MSESQQETLKVSKSVYEKFKKDIFELVKETELYIQSLEWQVKELQERIDELEEENTNLQHEVDTLNERE